jgi:hypothetical protein
MTRNGKIARLLAILREDFIQQGDDGSINPELTRRRINFSPFQYKPVQVSTSEFK